ncbi:MULTISPECIES: TIGR03943 family putative permease subunit [Bacillus]|uniref:TIGR03943 family putative permease subunit n=1 Tax=Bacillus TaxID=1386 RepID=UPI00042375A7|nr:MULTISPECIES: TIGR03943 family protein [Bacillus]QHZ47311.1 TIGR03943 family protein [Bacillus sp. NSP9.1]WFA03370.1 TIGR03943 family protein [Bacillus sp. HSf4]
MVFQPQQFLRALILAAFSGFIFKLHQTGEIYKLINPKYEYMSLIAAGAFAFLFIIQLSRIWTIREDHSGCCSCGHDHGRSKPFFIKMIHYAVIALPLITGFTFAPAVLNSSVAANKGTMLAKTSAPNTEGAGHVTTPEIENESSDIPKTAYDRKMAQFQQQNPLLMKDDLFADYYDEINENLDDYIGKHIKVKGFVHKEPGLKADQLVVSRFLITHCIADASLIGLLAEWDGAEHIKRDTWVELEGILGKASYQGTVIPIIQAKQWKTVQEPKHPYVYPVSINMTE